MELKYRMIMDEYRQARQDFLELGDIVHGILRQLVKDAGIEVMAIEHRVKEENSLAGKLERKGDMYNSLADLTDILGTRVIFFFADEVDRFATMVENTFVIDWENSEDKRALLNPDTFGYLSLHYICSLPEDGTYPQHLCNKKFELQIRSTLQHAWAAVNHDLGYKSEFGVPRAIQRGFSRLAGLLEIADDQFVTIRDSARKYSETIRQKIANDEVDDVSIDSVSLREYVLRNKSMRAFLHELAALCGAEISEIDPENYVRQLSWLGKRQLGEVQQMLSDNHDLALALAAQSLAVTDLDILSSSVGLRFLCRAELLNKKYSEEQIAQFLTLSTGSQSRSERQAKQLLRSYEQLKVNGEI